MKDKRTYYHLKLEKPVVQTAVITAVLIAGLLLTLTEVGQIQTLQQRAQIIDHAPAPNNDAECAAPGATAGVACDVANNFHCVNGKCVVPPPAPPAGAPPAAAAPAAAPPTQAQLDKACPVGQGLAPVACDTTNGYSCVYNAATKTGGCTKPVSGTPGLTNNNNCMPANPKNDPNLKGLVCDVKAGYTCDKGFCIRKAPGIPTQSSATGGPLAGQTAGSTAGGAESRKPVPGEVCNALTKLSVEEAKKLNGVCPEVDAKGVGICQSFCKASENNLPDKCKPGPAGILHCTNTNGLCMSGEGKDPCLNGPAQGYCAPAEGGTCCRKPPPPPPPAPPAAPAKAVVAPRVAPRVAPVRGAIKPPPGALARCRSTCKAPNVCSSAGRCNKPTAPKPGACTSDAQCKAKNGTWLCMAGTCRAPAKPAVPARPAAPAAPTCKGAGQACISGSCCAPLVCILARPGSGTCGVNTGIPPAK